MQEKICVFTHHPNDDKQIEIFRKSFDAHHGWGVCVLGLDTECSMMECYMDALRITDKKRVVVCMDAKNTSCARDSTDFIKDFLSCDTPILIANWNNKKDGFCIVGYAGDICNMFEWSAEHGKNMKQFPGKIKLDKNKTIFDTYFVRNSGYNFSRLVLVSALTVAVVCSLVKIDFWNKLKNKK